MLIYELVGMYGRLVDHLVGLSSGVLKDRFLVGDDALVVTDLIGNPCTELFKERVELILIYLFWKKSDICRNQ